MSDPESILSPAQHEDLDGPVKGWSATEFPESHYVGDDVTDQLEEVADGTQQS